MNLSRPFILRPVATTLLMGAILLAGLLAYRFLPVSALPQVDVPTIQVSTFYPGASPQVMTSAVTAPLERQFGQMAGLAQMTSSSSGGASVITLQFDLNTLLDVAEQEVQAAINAATNLLPSDLPLPPVYNKINPADAPVAILAVMSKTLALPKLTDLVDVHVAQKMAQLSGVGMVSLAGAQRPAVRVGVNVPALAANGLGLSDIQNAISNANVNLPKGSFDGAQTASTLDGNDQLVSADDYRRLILRYNNGHTLRLGDVAHVHDGAENARLAAWANRTPAVIVNIQRQSGANVIEVVQRIKALLPLLKTSLPAAVDLVLLTDRTVTIRASITDVEFELSLAVALVVMVIFLFLRNVSATLIPAITVPLSLIGTFVFMFFAGFSINNLSLMALTIATGFVVDDAIVMIENIARYLEKGETPLNAALKGAKQIGFTILSLTFSLIAVLIPLLLMGDVVGRLFREFAVTLAVAILISAVVSLTLTPMMCARLLKQVPEEKQGRFYHSMGQFFDRVTASYGRALSWVLQHQGLTLAVALASFVLTVLLYLWVPKGFFPQQDTGTIAVMTVAPQSISFSAMAQRQQDVAAILLEDPAIDSLSSFIGIDGSNLTLNSGRMLVNLKPHRKRDALATIIARLNARFSQLAALQVYLQPVQDLSIDASIARAPYQFILQATLPDELQKWTPLLLEQLKRSPALSQVSHDLQSNGLQAYIKIDRDSASRLGISVADVDNALYSAFGQRQVSTIFTQTNQYRVVLEQKTAYQGLAQLDALYLPTASGSFIPLPTIAQVKEKKALLAINHLGQFPSASFSFDLPTQVSLDRAVKAVQTAKATLALPESLQIFFQGAARAFQASLANTLWLILAAIVTMYIVLGVLYESTIHPITILSTLPSAAIGALLALIVAGSELGIVAVIGIILLIGIVKKNAIMMIDFALDAVRLDHLSPREAIYQACLLRLRPILMTTFAALLGALPLMLGHGVGSELRSPLGLTMVGGLLVSQVLTLFTTPVIYLMFERIRKQRTDDR